MPKIYTHCVVCGAELTGKQRKYCSRACLTEFHQKKKKPLKPCIVCGKLTKWQRFCSTECKKIYEKKQRNIKRASGNNYIFNVKTRTWQHVDYDVNGNIIKRGPIFLVLKENLSVREKNVAPALIP